MSQSFEDLVAQYQGLVMSLIRRYYGGDLGDRADDLAQEIWIRLWASFEKNERNIVNFKSYLYRTVQTTLWDAIRSLEKERRLEPLEDHEQTHQAEDLIHLRMDLDQQLASLKPDEARMIRAHLKGFSTDEIATLLNCSEGRVRNLLSRLKRKLTLLGGPEDAHHP